MKLVTLFQQVNAVMVWELVHTCRTTAPVYYVRKVSFNLLASQFFTSEVYNNSTTCEYHIVVNENICIAWTELISGHSQLQDTVKARTLHGHTTFVRMSAQSSRMM